MATSVAAQEVAEESFLNTRDDTKKLCEAFVQSVIAGKTDDAFKSIKPYMPVPENEFGMLHLQTVKQLGMVEPRFGAAVGYEFVKEEAMHDSVVMYTYIQKFERHIIRWMFIFYKPKDKWLLNAFTWDDKIHELFD
jgi:hypothetical protein